MFKLLSKSGPIIIIVLSMIPLIWWWPTATASYRSIGQGAGLIGSVLLALNFVLSARLKWLEVFFAGLNRMYIVHAVVGSLSYLLLIIHPFSLLLSYLELSVEAAISFITPTFSDIPLLLGSSAFGLMTVLVLLSLFRLLPYHTWKSTHQWMSLVLLLGSFHAVQIGTTLMMEPGLKYYLVSVYTLGLGAFLYKKLARLHKTNRFLYRVCKVEVKNSVFVVSMEPIKRALEFIPGQFAFFTFLSKGLVRESHPFSLVSSPTNSGIQIAAKQLGDYTEKMNFIKAGDLVVVEGAFGRFSYEFSTNTRFVWIAGGIGITPFTSMLASLPNNHAFDITLIYSIKSESDAVFDAKLQKLASAKKVKYILYTSTSLGRLSVKSISKILGWEKASYFICGPNSMMKSLKSQLQQRGITAAHIHTEEFSLN